MFRRVNVIVLVALTLLFTAMVSPCLASSKNNIPNVSQEMLNANFWINKMSEPEKLIMTQGEIAAFNNFRVESSPVLMPLCPSTNIRNPAA